MKKETIKRGLYKMYTIENNQSIKKDYECCFQNPQDSEIKFSALYILLQDDSHQYYIGYTSNPTERLCTHRSKPKFEWSKALVFGINVVEKCTQRSNKE